MRSGAIFILIFFNIYNLYSQNITVNSSIDTNKILIGDKVKLKLEINQPKNLNLQFPVLIDTITKSVEVISFSKIDTLINNDNYNLKQEFIITSFDSGMQEIPELKFIFNLDTIYDTISTRALFFEVLTVPPDSTVKDIKDIKPPFEVPVTFKEILPYLLLVLGLIVVGVVVYLYFKKRKRNEPLIKILSKPTEPAHLIALRELKELKEKKLWQNEKIKEYYSELSEIIRKYIENRFEVSALEQTSDEIILFFKNSQFISSDSFKILEQILFNSDMVKFAKAKPLPDEHDAVFKNSCVFVENTKLFEDNNLRNSIKENSNE